MNVLSYPNECDAYLNSHRHSTWLHNSFLHHPTVTFAKDFAKLINQWLNISKFWTRCNMGKEMLCIKEQTHVISRNNWLEKLSIENKTHWFMNEQRLPRVPQQESLCASLQSWCPEDPLDLFWLPDS